MKKKLLILLSLILCLALCLSLTACGGGGSDEEEYEEDFAEEEVIDEDDSQPEEEEGEEAGDGDVVIAYDLDYIANNLTGAYGGVTENGEFVLFGANDDGSFALMLFATADQHLTFVGPAELNDTFVSIQDEVNGLEITFEVLYGSDEGLVIDLGEYGSGVLAEISIDELIGSFEEVVTTTAAMG